MFFTLLWLVDFLNFLLWNLPKFPQHITSCGIWILNKKKVGFVKAVVLIIQFFVFYFCQGTGVIDFPEKRAPAKVKYLLAVCQIFTEFHRRKCKKIHCQFCFLCSRWCPNTSKKQWHFLWEHANYMGVHLQRACDRKTIGSQLNSGVEAKKHYLIKPLNHDSSRMLNKFCYLKRACHGDFSYGIDSIENWLGVTVTECDRQGLWYTWSVGIPVGQTNTNHTY